ncbi:tyrosine-protein kinase Src64B, partial [Asbolus verrucosus]
GPPRFTTVDSNRYTPDPQRSHADIIRPRPTPTRPPLSVKGRIVVALYNYEARDSSDVSFKKGDRMEVIDDSEGDWLNVIHLITKVEGYIPGNFVAAELSVESEEKEAEKLLLAEENPRGTFLVRPSEHNPNGYSLSVKDWEEIREYHVKHYKIKPLDNGGFYISTNKTFLTLVELVNAYT